MPVNTLFVVFIIMMSTAMALFYLLHKHDFSPTSSIVWHHINILLSSIIYYLIDRLSFETVPIFVRRKNLISANGPARHVKFEGQTRLLLLTSRWSTSTSICWPHENRNQVVYLNVRLKNGAPWLTGHDVPSPLSSPPAEDCAYIRHPDKRVFHAVLGDLQSQRRPGRSLAVSPMPTSKSSPIQWCACQTGAAGVCRMSLPQNRSTTRSSMYKAFGTAQLRL